MIFLGIGFVYGVWPSETKVKITERENANIYFSLRKIKSFKDVKSSKDLRSLEDLKQSLRMEEDIGFFGAEYSLVNVIMKGAIITDIFLLKSDPYLPTQDLFLLKVKIFSKEREIYIKERTKLLRADRKKSPNGLSEFSVGDIINVSGALYFSGNYNDAFIADVVRNLSLWKDLLVYIGQIKSINPTANSFVLDIQGPDIPGVVKDTVVSITPDTKIYLGKELKKFSDLSVGMKVLVRAMPHHPRVFEVLVIRINPTEFPILTLSQ